MHSVNHILFITRSLDRGGAERQLTSLALGLARRGYGVGVLTFYKGGVFEETLRNGGVHIVDLEKRGRWDVINFLRTYFGVLRSASPRVLHGYLAVPNILAVLYGLVNPGTGVILGVRASDMKLENYDWLTRLTYFIEARLSRYADIIISNSYAGRRAMAERGFPLTKVEVIPNGIDTDAFVRDVRAGRAWRRKWGISDSDVIVGMAARLDPIKGYEVFLRAAALVTEKCPAVTFVCAGGGNVDYQSKLRETAVALGLDERVIWIGPSDDMQGVYSGFDIFCLTSQGEGFSNSIAEAMACGLPCVVSDVGDSKEIVGEIGMVVPANSADAVATAILRIIDLSPEQRSQLGAKGRERIVKNFSRQRMVQRTEELIRKCFQLPKIEDGDGR